MDGIEVIHGDARLVLPTLAGEAFDAVVTSPPYWGGLRDYGDPEQLGLERDPADYVAAIRDVFRLVRPCLKPDGCAWLNVGDVYAASGKGGGGNAGDRSSWASVRDRKGFRMPPAGYKQKDLTLVAFQLADALRRDGWYLRSTIIWRKPTAVEPKRADRPSVSHEYLFLLAPAEDYDCSDPGEPWWGHSVWDIPPDKSPDHPATMPRELARRCIVASVRPGGRVLDPFAGAGSTLRAAFKAGRRATGIELNPRYVDLCGRRLADIATPLFSPLEAS